MSERDFAYCAAQEGKAHSEVHRALWSTEHRKETNTMADATPMTYDEMKLAANALQKLSLAEADAFLKMTMEFTFSATKERRDEMRQTMMGLYYDAKDEVTFEEEMGETLYFNVPANWLSHEYPDAIYATVAINSDGTYPRISPTREVEGESEDYDWVDFYPTFEQIRKIQDAVPRK